MKKYLYGAGITGIQRYIFATNRLREIVGASELVEEICTTMFDGICRNDNQKIIAAAGNIRTVFSDRAALEAVFRIFPKIVQEKVPGTQVVQAVVEFDGNLTRENVNSLEQKLRTQRNMPMSVQWASFSSCKYAQRTGVPASGLYDKEFLDYGTICKQNAADHCRVALKFSSDIEFPKDISEIAGENNYIAVIHADGNSLGQALQSLSDGADYQDRWRRFSMALNDATINAAKNALERSIKCKGRRYPFRPIILGGDDLTVICRAEDALGFTSNFLKEFEKQTSARQSDLFRELTACAGIAIVKSSYPFHYAVGLAEMLCSEAKKVAKKGKPEKIPSCLMFHRELSGFVEDSFSEIHKRELEIAGIDMAFGPYAVSGGTILPSLDALQSGAVALKQHNPLRSGLRRYLGELSIDKNSATLLLDRMECVCQAKEQKILKQLKNSLKELNRKNEEQSLSALVTDQNNKSPINDLVLAAGMLTGEIQND